MWQLSHPILKTATFNIAGVGKTPVTQLWQGNMCVINALAQVNWSDTAADFQFEICQCGHVGCADGGWVSLRRAGAIGVILPAFQKIDQAEPALTDHYAPPDYLRSHGALWFEPTCYAEALLETAPAPNFDHLPALTGWEAAKLFQWEAPHQVLGPLHRAPTLPSDSVLASSEGNFLEQVPLLEERLQQLLNASKDAAVRPVTAQHQIISFYLDIAGIPTWKALVYDGLNYGLYLEPGYVIDDASCR